MSVRDQHRVPDGVHPRVQPMERTGSETVLDGTLAEPVVEQLPPRDDAVLGSDELRQRTWDLWPLICMGERSHV
jgi:hypothetical protein